MSRPTSHTAAHDTRIEYSGADDLDKVLVHLRRVKETADASKTERRTARAEATRPQTQRPDPTEKIAMPASRPASPRVPRMQPAAADPPPQPQSETRADARARTLPHMPEGTVDRLTAFVAGDTAAPPPVTTAAPLAGPRTLADVLGNRSELGRAVGASRQAFIAVGLFSLVINLLMLTGPIFMLQVYDRVMASGSMSTLAALSVLTAAMYGVIGLLELVRSRVIVRVGVELDRRIGDRVFEAALKRSIVGQGGSMSALRELDGLRQFIAGPGPLTFFDAPWTPIYLLIVFLMHWLLGLAAVLGAALLLVIAWASEVRSRAPMHQAGKASAKSIELAETAQRNAEAISAMGMLKAYRGRWQAANGDSLAWQVLASDRLGSLSSVSKALRLLLQSMMLAIGAALAIKGDISAGSIVAATIIFGRALAPVEQAIGHWRGFVKAQEAYARLDQLLASHPAEQERTALPVPNGHLEVQNLRVAVPETRTLILNGINFEVVPGRMAAVIGPSGSGKSTLARAIVGIWPPVSGFVRLDGARLDQWNSEDRGRHIGYLPQDCELFAGSIRDNIARFRTDADDVDVIEAAMSAHAHDLIMSLPNGYETEVGPFGAHLSAGQRQRIGLARALFGNPPLVVLDEPNANLDRLGDEALAAAIDGMRARGQAVVLISHRVQAINKSDDLLYIDKGMQRAFGPRAEVLRLLQANWNGPSAAGGPSNPQTLQPQSQPAPRPPAS